MPVRHFLNLDGFDPAVAREILTRAARLKAERATGNTPIPKARPGP